MKFALFNNLPIFVKISTMYAIAKLTKLGLKYLLECPNNYTSITYDKRDATVYDEQWIALARIEELGLKNYNAIKIG